MSAMSVMIAGIVIRYTTIGVTAGIESRPTGIFHKIIADDIVDKTIPVVIDSIVGNFARVHPNVPFEVGVIVADTRIQNCYYDVGTSRFGVPSQVGINPVGRAQIPLIRIERVVRSHEQRMNPNLFDMIYARIACKISQSSLKVHTTRDSHFVMATQVRQG